jgi:hypothetical protein
VLCDNAYQYQNSRNDTHTHCQSFDIREWSPTDYALRSPPDRVEKHDLAEIESVPRESIASGFWVDMPPSTGSNISRWEPHRHLRNSVSEHSFCDSIVEVLCGSQDEAEAAKKVENCLKEDERSASYRVPCPGSRLELWRTSSTRLTGNVLDLEPGREWERSEKITRWRTHRWHSAHDISLSDFSAHDFTSMHCCQGSIRYGLSMNIYRDSGCHPGGAGACYERSASECPDI